MGRESNEWGESNWGTILILDQKIIIFVVEPLIYV
jgi:hypothetical protein